MADRTVKLVLSANIQGLRSQLTAAQASVNDFAKTADKRLRDNTASANTLATSFGVVGAAAVGLAGLAVKRFADFDKAMSSVKASTRASGAELESLRAKAVKAGADTAFSAVEAAQGIDELAKAGVATKDILGGGLAGALNLAAAGQLSVAEAAETAASAMVQFNLDGSQVGHVADLLAAGAGKAQGSVHDMGAALQQSGLIAAQTGLSVEETTSALAAMASAGLVGSDAGTSLKTALVALSAPSSTAASEMDRLGISAYDANGQFVGLEALAGNLKGALYDLTPAQRNAAMATIFGTDALRTANVLYEQGAQGISAWTDKVNDSGYAAETARIQTDNLAGDLERLGGAFDTALIQSGSGANDVLRGLVQGAEGAVDAFGRLPAPVLSATGLIAGSGGLALLGIAGLGKLAVSVAEARSAVQALGISAKTAGVAAGALGAALAVGTIALTAWADNAAEAKTRTDALKGTLDEFGATTDATVRSLNETLSAPNQVNLWEKIFGPPKENDTRSAFELAERLKIASEDVTLAILGQADAQERVNAALAKADDVSVWDTDTRFAAESLTKIIDEQKTSLEQSTTEKQRAAAADRASGAAAEGATGATKDATAALGDMTEALEDQWQAAMDASGAVLGLRDAQRQAEAAYDDARKALKDNGKTLDESTEKGRANQAALDAIAASGLEVVASVRATGGSLKDVQGAMATARKRFIDTAVSMGMGENAAKRLADKLELIPGNVTTKVDVNTAAAISAINSINSTLNSIDGRTVTANVAIKRYGQAALATGGSVVGPGTGTSDSVPAMLSNGEHVWTAAEVRAAGGQSAMYAMRAAVRGGMQAYASGGEVGAARQELDRRRRDVEAAQAAVRRSRTDRNEARLAAARDAADDARARYGRLLEEQESARTSLRRGEIRGNVTGGLSSAYSAVDQLRELAGSGDFSSSRARSLRGTAGKAEPILKMLYKDAERAEKKLTDARSRLEELVQVRNGVQSDIVGGFSLSSVRGEFDPKTGKRVASASALAGAARAYAAKAKKFPALLNRLGDKSGSPAIVQEVAGYGVEEGIPLAQSLLSDLPSLRSLASSYKAIDKYGARAGSAVARAVGGGEGIPEALRAAKSAQANVAAIDKRIGSWAKRIGNETARALGIKPRAAGGDMTPGGAYITGEFGRELVLPQRPGYVLTADATRRLADRAGAGTYSAPASSTYNDNRLSVTTNRDVSDEALLRFDRKRRLLGVRT